MERTYRINRVRWGLHTFVLAALWGGGGVIGIMASQLFYRLGTSIRGGEVFVVLALFGVAISVGALVQFVRLMIAAKRMLGFTVDLSDTGIKVGNTKLEWDEIASVEHAVSGMDLAFRINTRDGRRVDVYPIEGAHQAEDVVRGKIVANTQ